MVGSAMNTSANGPERISPPPEEAAVVAVGKTTASLVGTAVAGTSVGAGVVAVGWGVAVAELPQAMMNKTTNADNRVKIDFFMETSSDSNRVEI